MKKITILFVTFIILLSCVSQENNNINENNESTFKFSTWITANIDKSDEGYKKEFRSYLEAGIDEILINTLTDPILLERLAILAKKRRIESTRMDHGYE